MASRIAGLFIWRLEVLIDWEALPVLVVSDAWQRSLLSVSSIVIEHCPSDQDGLWTCLCVHAFKYVASPACCGAGSGSSGLGGAETSRAWGGGALPSPCSRPGALERVLGAAAAALRRAGAPSRPPASRRRPTRPPTHPVFTALQDEGAEAEVELPAGKGPQLPFPQPAPLKATLLDVTLPVSLSALWLALFHNASSLLADFHQQLGDLDIDISRWRQKGALRS